MGLYLLFSGSKSNLPLFTHIRHTDIEYNKLPDLYLKQRNCFLDWDADGAKSEKVGISKQDSRGTFLESHKCLLFDYN